MSLHDENSAGTTGPVTGTMTMTPSSEREGEGGRPVRGLLGDFTPSPAKAKGAGQVKGAGTAKVPMSLQKDMRSAATSSLSHSSHSHSHSVVTHASSASKVLSTPYTSESFQKTFKEFGHLIEQRRAELSEMKRSNQLRLNNQHRQSMSDTPGSHDMLRDHGSTPITVESPQMTSPRSTPGSQEDGGTRVLARKLILGQQRSPLQETGVGESDHASSLNLLQDMSAEQQHHQQDDQESPPAPAPSVIMGMEVQLREEISRTQKLNEKIEELHQLEEVQRNKAHMLAMEKDKLETVRCDQVEKLASLELKQQEHLNLLQSRQKRISDLEKELSNIGSSRNEWNAKILKLEEERNSLKIEFSKHQSKFNEKEAQLQAANEQLVKEKKEQSAAADKEIKRRDGVIEAKQKEFDEMSKDNKTLRNGKETLERQHELAVKSKEKAEQSLKEKCNALQSLERQFTEMERANKKLMDDAHHHAQQLQKAEHEAAKWQSQVDQVNVENKKLKDKNQEVEAKCVGLQKAAEAKEQARVELEGQLVQLTKAEKSQRTAYRVKVVALLLGIWLLLLAVIYEHIVDFHPNTVSPYRITS